MEPIRAIILGIVEGLHEFLPMSMRPGHHQSRDRQEGGRPGVTPVLSVHVVVSDEALADAGGTPVLHALGECLADHFDVEHCTFQLEHTGHSQHETQTHT